MSDFQDFISETCDCLETFVGVNNMSYRQFGEWIFDSLKKDHYKEIKLLKEELKRERRYLDDMVKEGVKLSYLPRFTIREKAREIIAQRKIKDEDL